MFQRGTTPTKMCCNRDTYEHILQTGAPDATAVLHNLNNINYVYYILCSNFFFSFLYYNNIHLFYFLKHFQASKPCSNLYVLNHAFGYNCCINYVFLFSAILNFFIICRCQKVIFLRCFSFYAEIYYGFILFEHILK